MVKERNRRKQMWADKDFVEELEKVKAKRLLGGNPVKNLPQLTKEIMECPSFKKVMEEIERLNIREFNIKFDKKRIWD